MKTFLPTMIVSVCVLGPVLGCHHEAPKPQMPPMQAQAPALDPATHPVPMEIIPLEPQKTDTAAKPAPPPKASPTPTPTKSERRRKPSAAKPQVPATAAITPVPAPTPTPIPQEAPPPVPTPAPATTVAAAKANGVPSPIGQLTEGDVSGTAQVQTDTEKLIKSVETGLAGLQRPLNGQEQETVKQIKKFIEQARAALTSQDAGGAHTLAVKADLLLTELKK